MLRTRTFASLLVAACVTATSVAAEATISVSDAYARASTPTSVSGAAFMVIENHSDTPMRLIEVRSSIAERVELHTHKMTGNGVMRMVEVKEGIVIPAQDSHALKRGGDHVMFLGLTESLTQGKIVPMTLVFEDGKEVPIDVPVDLTNSGGHSQGHGQGHGGHKH